MDQENKRIADDFKRAGWVTAGLGATALAIGIAAQFLPESAPDVLPEEPVPTTHTPAEAQSISAILLDYTQYIFEDYVEKGFVTAEQAGELTAHAARLHEAMPDGLAQSLWDADKVYEERSYFFQDEWGLRTSAFLQTLSPELAEWRQKLALDGFTDSCFIAGGTLEGAPRVVKHCDNDSLTSYTQRGINSGSITVTYDFEENMAFYVPENSATSGYGEQDYEKMAAIPFDDLDEGRLTAIFEFKADVDEAIAESYRQYAQEFQSRYDVIRGEAQDAISRASDTGEAALDDRSQPSINGISPKL